MFSSKKKEEWPMYDSLAKKGSFEIRKYEPFVAVETTFKGKRGAKGQDEGFWALAGYIGVMSAPKNVKRDSETAEKIPMTSPVIMQEAEGDQPEDHPEMIMQFVLPSKYSMDTAPTPTDSKVTLTKVPAKTLGVLTFPGSWHENDVRVNAMELKKVLEEGGVKLAGSSPKFLSGFYNAPFVPYMLRRNEVWWEVEGLPSDLSAVFANVK